MYDINLPECKICRHKVKKKNPKNKKCGFCYTYYDRKQTYIIYNSHLVYVLIGFIQYALYSIDTCVFYAYEFIIKNKDKIHIHELRFIQHCIENALKKKEPIYKQKRDTEDFLSWLKQETSKE